MRDLVPNDILIGGRRIACGAHGDDDAPPVVLIHGTPSSSFIWRTVAPLVERTGRRVIVFDLLGYGASERPWEVAVDTSVSAQVAILEGVLAHFGVDHLDVVAHDIGGGVGQRFALFSPERVRSLTLIDTVSFDSWPSKRTQEQMAQGLEMLIKAPDAAHRAHFQDWLLSTVVDKQRLREGALDAYVDMISGPVGQGSFFQHQVAHYDPKHTSEISDRLSELGALPVQIIWGRDDAWQVVGWAEKLQAAIPGAELEVIPDCGHFAIEDKPAEVAALINAFLAANA